ncbi:protein-tyrosine-phosphatase [Microvirga terrae]|uniref:Protein-tyrosine-phosphatase n=1 Tax=Microvirga terrae TaxID=2740529 RepID=A0ABY5RLJ1_9HYPH|nr:MULTISPECIES: protein-tyrosine-phosphatase [Microvirga]MBQ0824203.1 protein-tyrosine-phosphatase [Microvirga sp. HBU67558]UVF18106.1 protein-tyrosine-phosphatase [Microvirga terrae]
MHRPSIQMLTVCGISELPDQRERSVTHVLSILDPDHPDPEVFEAYDPHHRTILRFHDIILPIPGMILPARTDVEAILRFGDEVGEGRADRAEGHLLVHCHMGVSRSTAAMLTLMAQSNPGEGEDALFERLVEIRPQAWPNSRMVDFADGLLSRDGRLTEALRRHYGRQIRRRPDYVRIMHDLGRGREVEMAA